MCGRYRNASNATAVEAVAGTTTWRGKEKFREGHTASPTTNNPVVVRDAQGARTVHVMRWGLIPSWAKDPKKLPTLMFNARGETVAERPSFRGAVKASQRCVVVTDGFYEWYRGKDPKYSSPKGAPLQPYLVEPSEGGLMLMAGLYDTWRDDAGEEVFTYTIITIDSSTTSITWLHDRIPVILRDEDVEGWLDAQNIRGNKAIDQFVHPFHGKLQTTRMSDDLRSALPAGARAPDILAAFAKAASMGKKRKPQDDAKRIDTVDPSAQAKGKLDGNEDSEVAESRSQQDLDNTPRESAKVVSSKAFPKSRDSDKGLHATKPVRKPAKRQKTVDQFFSKT